VQQVEERFRRRHTLLLSLTFFIGVILSITALGIAAAYIGRILTQWATGFAIATGLTSLLAGLAVLAAPWIRRHVRGPNIRSGSGPAGAFLYGMSYTVATATTGAGPLLLILTIVAAIGRPVYGALLSLFYGIGRGVPFLLMGIFAGGLGAWLARFDRARRTVEVLSGLALVLMAIYFLRLSTRV
jgi:cytochrome c-type biogenesis protein